MLFFHSPQNNGPFGKSLLPFGLFCVLFGIAILAAPELLAYLVASFLIVVGIFVLTTWWNVRK